MEKIINRKDFENKKRRIVFKEGNKQILVIGVGEEVFALDNRCPHEGYPLSEGTTEGKSCVLTCNWHNWKFDLKTGKCFLGGDNVRTYQIKKTDSEIKINLNEPTKEEIRDTIIEGLKEAFARRQYGRMARELSRLSFNKLDPLFAVKKSIIWSFDKFEYGMTHAYAALADWLNLYQNSDKIEDRIICLTEAIDHIALDCLRHNSYPYSVQEIPFSEESLYNAIESEDRESAESIINTFFNNGGEFSDLEWILSKAALAHYNDFGHSLIYVVKCFETSHYLRDKQIDRALALCLVRSLCYTTREDLIPEFNRYSDTLKIINLGKTNCNEKSELGKFNVDSSYDWILKNYYQFNEQELYDYLLLKNADNFLKYNIALQNATNNPVTKNVGWLDFTHAITFSNAVRMTCQKFPQLWKAGLLQMISFYGRNTTFTDDQIQLSDWKVEESKAFKNHVIEKILDHGMAGPIFSAHIIKTFFAVFSEIEHSSIETKDHLLASLNRFLNSPLKQRHGRRMVTQGINLVSKDFDR